MSWRAPIRLFFLSLSFFNARIHYFTVRAPHLVFALEWCAEKKRGEERREKLNLVRKFTRSKFPCCKRDDTSDFCQFLGIVNTANNMNSRTSLFATIITYASDTSNCILEKSHNSSASLSRALVLLRTDFKYDPLIDFIRNYARFPFGEIMDLIIYKNLR